MIARGITIGAIGLYSGGSERQYDDEDVDVAEQIASKGALAIANARLVAESLAAAEAKSDFLAVMSHELRTPLTAIIGYAELLQLGVPEPVTERQHEQAERIEMSARQLLQMIEEILTLVTLENGEPTVSISRVGINETLRRAFSTVEPLARAKGLDFQLQEMDEEVEIDTDADKLLQIVLNLLSNGIKFTDRGEIALRGRASEDQIVIEVSDTGIGLPQEQADRVFEPFWQAERPITRKSGGAGLGLTIAHRLADVLGGRLAFESNPDQVTLFWFTLPRP